MPPPAAVPHSDATNHATGDGAVLFAGGNTGWTPVEVATTSQTEFQAMDAKIEAASGTHSASADGLQTPGSVIVGTSHIVTTIVDESATLPEPQVLLYSGGYRE